MARAEPAAGRRLRAPWQRADGDDGRVADALDELASAGHRVLRGVDTGYGEVDVVVAGPAGVFAILEARGGGAIHAKRGKLLSGFHDEERTRRRAIWSAACLEQWLDEDGVDVPVVALLVAVEATVEHDRIELPHLTVLSLASLSAFLQEGPTVLRQSQIERALDAICRRAPGTRFGEPAGRRRTASA
jgi:hypothetical protein